MIAPLKAKGDLIVCRDERLERVQCKYTESNDAFIVVRCRSHSLTNGKVRAVKRYTAAIIGWLAVYDVTTERFGGRVLGDLMEPAGLEPATSSVQATRSSN